MKKGPISFNSSSLLSLKAELLRKKQEVNTQRPLHTPSVIKTKLKGCDAPNQKRKSDNVTIEVDDPVEPLDFEDLNKSKRALEVKARLYENLKNERKDVGNNSYLVRFNDKDERNSDEEDENDWVEYTDCLGRTKTCLRKDVNEIHRRDKELRDSLPSSRVTERGYSSSPSPPPSETKYSNFLKEGTSRKPDLDHENFLMDLRRKWQEQEAKAAEKPSVHYQDVLYDEARSHGTGYYSFSSDEKEREKQQEALNKLHKDTQKQQQEAVKLKEMREKQLEARGRAAKIRKKMREGFTKEEATIVVEAELLNEQKEKEKLREIEETEKDEDVDDTAKIQETIANLARENHVRPWDIGKLPITDDLMSQEDWVAKKRDERVDEFRPPMGYDNYKSNRRDNEPERKKSRKYEASSWETIPEDVDPTPHKFSWKQSSRDERSNRRNDDDEPVGHYAAIPPPSQYPDTSRVKTTAINIESSIEAGLKFLRSQSQSSNTRDDVGYFE